MNSYFAYIPRRPCLTILRVAFAVGPILVGGCTQAPSISHGDVESVLTLAAAAVNKKLHGSYCIRPKLGNSNVTWEGRVGKDGWITAPDNKNLRYRPLPAPKIETLPNAAMAAFTNSVFASECRHAIEFNKPLFIEMKSQNENYIEASVEFSDRCPVCGFGAVVEFRKINGRWEMTSDGIQQTWIS